MQVATGAAISSTWETQVYPAAASLGTDGKPVLSQFMSNSDLSLPSTAIVSASDASDGLGDGQVLDPTACQFDPAALQCPVTKTATCLSSTQVSALKKAFSGPKNSAGQALYASWPWDSGVNAAAGGNGNSARRPPRPRIRASSR